MTDHRGQNAPLRSGWIAGAAASTLLLSLPTTSWAWAAKSYYPNAFEPTLPNAEEAQNYRLKASTLFRTLSHAHRQSLAHSWKSITPPVTEHAKSD